MRQYLPLKSPLFSVRRTGVSTESAPCSAMGERTGGKSGGEVMCSPHSKSLGAMEHELRNTSGREWLVISVPGKTGGWRVRIHDITSMGRGQMTRSGLQRPWQGGLGMSPVTAGHHGSRFQPPEEDSIDPDRRLRFKMNRISLVLYVFEIFHLKI